MDFEAGFDDEFEVDKRGPITQVNWTWPAAFLLMASILRHRPDTTIETWDFHKFLRVNKLPVDTSLTEEVIQAFPWTFALRFQYDQVRSVVIGPGGVVYIQDQSGWRADGPWQALEGDSAQLAIHRYRDIWKVAERPTTHGEWACNSAAHRFERLSPLLATLQRWISSSSADEPSAPLLTFVPNLGSDDAVTDSLVALGTWELNGSALREIWPDEQWPLPRQLMAQQGDGVYLDEHPNGPGGAIHEALVGDLHF